MKNSKTFNVPFLEVHREWLDHLSKCRTLVVVGVSNADQHLRKQIEGSLITNSQFEKLILINPDSATNNAFCAHMKRIAGEKTERRVFIIDCKWDADKIEATIGKPLSEIIKMRRAELRDWFQQDLEKAAT